MFHRRHFLKSTAAAIAALILPRSLFARNPDHCFFIHTDTLNSWPVPDPVVWSLKHAREPVLERAAEGLRKLTPSDGDRIVRLVVRRCGLYLIELQPGHVIVQHWGPHRADLRPFFKQHMLARPEIEVVLRERKKEIITRKTGDDFLFGSRIAPDFPLDLFQNKWARRFERDADDWQATPGSASGLAWAGIEDGKIPWEAMKSAWRRSAKTICQNCDTPTLLVNFGQPWTSLFSRTPRFIHVCGTCRRSFKDESMKDVGQWIVANVDAEAQPAYDMVWDRKVKHR